MIGTLYGLCDQYVRYRKRISFGQFWKFQSYSQIKSKEDKIIDITLTGLKYPFYLRCNKSDFSVFRDFFLKTDYAPTLPGAKRIIDAGANIGAATLIFRQRYPDADIIAIEPDNDNCRIFRKNTEKYSGITLLQGGVASMHKAFMEIIDKSVSPYSYQMTYSVNGLPSFSINGLMKENGWEDVDIVKIDIEGGEREVFSSNTDWIARTRQIIIELHDYKVQGCSYALIKAIKDHDFNISFSGENLILTKADVPV